MIVFTQVTKRFSNPPLPGRAPGEVTALSDVSLEIGGGGVWGVVGPNGAGKTTLFGLLLGFLRPTEGTVRIAGDAPRDYMREHGAAYLPERFVPPAEWTVRGALRALARLEGLGGAARGRADAALERLGLEAHAGKTVGALSRGLLQRLGVAQALLAERELVVLDEPTEGLDPLWRVRFREIVESLRESGRTVLLASHDLVEVERLAGRVVLLESGRVREVLETAPAAGGPRRYRLTLAVPTPLVAEAFPGAAALEGAAAYAVEVADAVELSARLAALIEAGGVVVAVLPEGEPLEARVRRSLEGGA